MFINERSTFDDYIKPLAYLNCFVGMGAYRPPNISDIAYFLMQLYTIIFTSLNWILTYIFLTRIVLDDEYYRDDSSPAQTMYGVLGFLNSFIAVVFPFLIWLQNKVFGDCLRKMATLDETFQDILGVRIEYRKQFMRLIWHVIGIFFVVFVLLILDMPRVMLGKRSLLNIFTFAFGLHYPIIISLVLDLNFYTYLGYLGKKFKNINVGLLGLAEKISAPYTGKKILVTPREVLKATSWSRMKDTKFQSLISSNRHLLHEIRKAHLDLCKLSRKVNDAFGIQNLLSMGISFGIVIGLSYNTYSDISLWKDFKFNKLTDIISSLIWILIYAFEIFIVNHSCWTVSNEAERTGNVIYELFETRGDKELQKVIKGFAVQMLQNPVRFDACGFFLLDYRFVQGVIGSITTYLVILIQMNQLTASPASNTTLA